MPRRLLSGRAIRIGLLVLLPVLILSFFALGRLRNSTPDQQPDLKAAPQVSHPAARPQEEPQTTTPAPAAESQTSGSLPADKAEPGASPAPAAPPQAQPSERPAASAQPEAQPRAIAPIQPAAPVWQTLSERWDRAKPSNPPQLKTPAAQKIPWRQLDLGQTEEVDAGKGQKSLEIATMRKSPEERAKEKALEEKQKAKPAAPAQTSPAPQAKPEATPPSAKPAATSAKADVSSRMAIVNHSGQTELGTAYRDVLASMGFPVAQIIPQPTHSGPTQVYFKPDAEPLARRIFDRLPGRKTIEPLNWKSTFDVVIIVQRGAPRLDASAEQ